MNALNHVSIIMDGNGRWGLKNKNSRNLGHKEGLKNIQKIINICLKYNIKFLTLFVFSTDNWKRPLEEVNYLFYLFENFLKKKINEINKRNIKLKILGQNLDNYNLSKLIKTAEQKTKKNSKIQINIAINYGSRKEIIESCKSLIKNKKDIDEKNVSDNLYTKNIPDPDILIRTGNTNRLSNFLLWQLSYTEIFFEKKLWPDFNDLDFERIIKKFKKIKRNFGSI